AETGENGYTQIGGQMPQTGTVKDKGTARRAEMRVHQGEGSEHTKAKEEDSGNGSGDELAQYQQLATHGSKKVVVQAFLYDVAAKEPSKDAEATEEDSQAEIKNLKDVSQDFRVFLKITTASAPAVDGMRSDDQDRSKGQHVDPRATPGEEVFLKIG